MTGKMIGTLHGSAAKAKIEPDMPAARNLEAGRTLANHQTVPDSFQAYDNLSRFNAC